MKKHGSVLILSALLSAGMSEPGRVPDEMIDLPVVVVDSEGVEHRLRGLVCEGESSLELRKGTLRYRIPLRSVDRIEVLEADDPVKVKVRMRSGREDIFEAERGTRCSSESDTGSVTFYIDEVRTIRIGVKR
ncbi:MAG: hypothetical protein Q9N26_06665 [Aquificota bacterium]|nr:hypothetical protein [Aquificota bacterium]